MKALILALLLIYTPAFSHAADALSVTDSEGVTVTIYQRPCTNAAILAYVPKANAVLTKAKAPTLIDPKAFYAGSVSEAKPPSQVEACWAQIANQVVVVTEKQDVYAIPTSVFEVAIVI